MIRNYSTFDKLINRYNAAAWIAESGHTVLIVREVTIAGGKGEPDKGSMILIEIDPQGNIVHESVIWKPQGDDQLLEDPRALVLSQGKVLMGLTAVLKGNKYYPYPAITTLENTSYKGYLPQVNIIKDFGPGKNTTPVDDKTFFFRQDGPENNHKLFVFEWDGLRPKGIGEIYFPKNIDWASWRIGTTMPPIWINDAEALMLIHGIKIQDGKYVYSLGRAKLFKDSYSSSTPRFEVEVDPMPLLTPDNFVSENGEPTIEELHPQLRRVVYACGGVVRQKSEQQILSLYVNVGDTQTVEVPLEINHLKSGWWTN